MMSHIVDEDDVLVLGVYGIYSCRMQGSADGQRRRWTRGDCNRLATSPATHALRLCSKLSATARA